MILRGDKPHTVATLTYKLAKLVELGLGDTGFPVLTREENLPGTIPGPASAQLQQASRAGFRIVGFLGVNELAHALCESSLSAFRR